MLTSLRLLQTFILGVNAKRKSEEGASAVEYGLMVAAIAAVIVGVVFVVGDIIGGAFDDTCSELKAGTASTAVCP